jgi:hypothetical protein
LQGSERPKDGRGKRLRAPEDITPYDQQTVEIHLWTQRILRSDDMQEIRAHFKFLHLEKTGLAGAKLAYFPLEPRPFSADFGHDVLSKYLTIVITRFQSIVLALASDGGDGIMFLWNERGFI